MFVAFLIHLVSYKRDLTTIGIAAIAPAVLINVGTAICIASRKEYYLLIIQSLMPSQCFRYPIINCTCMPSKDNPTFMKGGDLLWPTLP